MAVPTRSEVEALLANRMAAEPAFIEYLIADPHGALAELLGVVIPESVRVVLHEESPTEIHLTIPAPNDLTDEDLQLVAGGGFDSNFNPWCFGYGAPGSCPPPPGSSGGCVMG